MPTVLSPPDFWTVTELDNLEVAKWLEEFDKLQKGADATPAPAPRPVEVTFTVGRFAVIRLFATAAIALALPLTLALVQSIASKEVMTRTRRRRDKSRKCVIVCLEIVSATMQTQEELNRYFRSAAMPTNDHAKRVRRTFRSRA